CPAPRPPWRAQPRAGPHRQRARPRPVPAWTRPRLPLSNAPDAGRPSVGRRPATVGPGDGRRPATVAAPPRRLITPAPAPAYGRLRAGQHAGHALRGRRSPMIDRETCIPTAFL